MNVRGALGLSLAGAALLVVPAQRYRVDRVLCERWPGLAENLLYSAVYLLAVALLSAGWLALVRVLGRTHAPVGRVLALGVPVHLITWCGPPFLSQDPAFYAALGRMLARAPGLLAGRALSLCQVLPLTDPFLQPLPEAWRCGTSAYGLGFDALAAAFGHTVEHFSQIGADPLALHLRLHQASSAAALFLGAALCGRAAGRHGARAAALVLFCPLAVIEATGNAHNDVYLLLATAGFVYCVRRGPVWARPLPLLLGVLAKSSALLLLAQQGARCLPGGRRARAVGGGLLILGLVAGALLLGPGLPSVVRQLLGGGLAYEYCTRSIECLPRTVLREVLHAPRLALAVNLLFRGAGALLILGLGARYCRQPLRGAAALIFYYYLYLHGWAQTWYWLPLLPLLPCASPRQRPAMLGLCMCAVVYYALAIPFNCVTAPWSIALTDLCEGLIVVGPPTIYLLCRRTHADLPVQKPALAP